MGEKKKYTQKLEGVRGTCILKVSRNQTSFFILCSSRKAVSVYSKHRNKDSYTHICININIYILPTEQGDKGNTRILPCSEWPILRETFSKGFAASLDQKIYFCYRACVNVPQGAFRGGGSAGSSSSTGSSPSTTLPLQTSLSPCTRCGKTICTLPYMLGPLGFTQAVQGSSPMAGRIFPAVKAFTSTTFYVSGSVWRQPTLNAPW